MCLLVILDGPAAAVHELRTGMFLLDAERFVRRTPRGVYAGRHTRPDTQVVAIADELYAIVVLDLNDVRTIVEFAADSD